MQSSKLTEFYRGGGRDHRGRLLSHIHQYAFHDLERHHDYIQWLFPLPEPSGAIAEAPLLSADDIAAFKADASLRKMLRQSFELMLQFYGLDLEGGDDDPTVVRSDTFVARSNIWLTPGNHNFLRISRILRSMSLLGLRQDAVAFLKSLEGIYAEEPQTIGETTIRYWRQAVATNNQH